MEAALRAGGRSILGESAYNTRGMSSSGLTYAQLEKSFIAWAEGQAAIRGAVVVGSRAGPDA